jgi:hypothetical protein
VASTFWGKALREIVAVGLCTEPYTRGFVVGITKYATSGGAPGSFDKGYKEGKELAIEMVTAIRDAAADFGDRHADHIEKTLITGVAIGVGAVVKKEFIDTSSTTPQIVNNVPMIIKVNRDDIV